ncbi:MAG: alpha/beta fold hydrolase [Phormidesmis sp. RL_2_1]|nr:alpha/beta fold hydrolase [Phormidesmis sp. RL_2_1]
MIRLARRPVKAPSARLGGCSLEARSWGLLGGLCLSSWLAVATAKPVIAAERVTLTYGFLEVSVSVESLRAYGERGEISDELAPYLGFLDEAQRSQFRQALQIRQDVSPVQISKFLYSSIGENILRYLGTIVRTAGRLDGAKGLRSALVLAAAAPEGLSVLGVIEQFPTDNMRIDSQLGLQAFGALTQLINDTERAIALIAQQSSTARTATDATSGAVLADLTQAGPFAITLQTLELVDSSRDRTLTTDVYLPESSSPVPLVVISHGLASDRKSFVPIAEHLASHGVAVAALDHPGSDRRQLEDLLRGIDDEIAEPSEFADRPRDISYLLDELTRLNTDNSTGNPDVTESSDQPSAHSLFNRLDMSRIGLIGHSFGGYTALAIAGAQLDYETLQANCASEAFIFNAANPSMLLQCTALAAPAQFTADLEDDRIQAVIALNPLTSSLFGPAGFSQIDIPLLLVAGSDDPITPALLEQIQPFTWLNSSAAAADQTNLETQLPEHYLALIQGGSHGYEPVEFQGADLTLARQLVSADMALAYRYLKALSLGFMQAEIMPDSPNQTAFMSPALNGLSQLPLPLYVVDALSQAMLTGDDGASNPPANDPANSTLENLPSSLPADVSPQ